MTQASSALFCVAALALSACEMKTIALPVTVPPGGGNFTTPAKPSSPDPQTPAATDTRVMGYLDGITSDGRAEGWTLSPYLESTPNQAAFFVDGPFGSGKWAGTVTANRQRQDVNDALELPGDHGFSFTIPDVYKDGQSHQLFAYGLSSVLSYLPAEQGMGHQSGYADGTSWATDVTQPTNTFLTFGPYSNALPAGDYVAQFALVIDNNSADNVDVASLDVTDMGHGGVLAHLDLKRGDFARVNAPVTFSVPFTVRDEDALEFRVFYKCCTYLKHVATAIFKAAPGMTPAEPYLLDGSPKTFQFAKIEPPVTELPKHTKAQILDTQGDLMIWGGPEFALQCGTGRDPETGILCRDDRGAAPRGLMAGYVWSLDIPRYTPARREQLYQKILGYGFTHVAIQVTACQPGTGYHGLYPMTAADCVGWTDRVNATLTEIRKHGLITVCTGITQNDPPTPGLDVSLCEAVMDDWDNTDQKDCHINAMSQWFPDAWHFIEMPEGAIQPARDACTPAGLLPAPNGGGAWIREAQRRDPKLVAVLLEISYPYGHDENLREFQAYNPWWRDLAQNRFEIDTYWKYWDAYPFQESKIYNDWFITNTPWLVGFFSGGTTHAPLVETPSTGGFLGELDLHGAVMQHIASDFADWPVTTRITKIELRQTGVHIEMDNGRPGAWPDFTPPGWDGPLLWSMGIAEKINGTWYASAPIQLWRGLDESGGPIQLQNVNDGTGRGQIRANWFYDPGRWGPMAYYDPKPGETIGIFVCAGDCRDANPGFSPAHERSNVVLFSLPGPNETVTLTK